MKVKAKDVQPKDIITTITGNVEIVKDVLVDCNDCWIRFEGGREYHCFPLEYIRVKRDETVSKEVCE